jgi:membrane-associated protease RseP (regulator of RpoE activity)
VPVPAALFQGSLLLGGVSSLFLDPEAFSHTQIFVSPLVIAGWCGITNTALNMLPIGNLDGGRAMLVSTYAWQHYLPLHGA